MSETEIIQYAVTLTTGDDYNPMLLKCRNNNLNDLLFEYKKYFQDFEFYLEILDKQLMETKIHYHGYINVSVRNIQHYQKFIRSWKAKYFVMVKLIDDFSKWTEYIKKQQHIYMIGYPEISRSKFTKNNTLKYVSTSNTLQKFRIR